MKIGELAQLCGVPQATIRYYVRIGMLLPNHAGAQYDFSQREYHDLQLILKMKQQQFNLKEIQNYLVLTRHSNFIEPDTISECLKLWETKRTEICKQIIQLQQSIQDIDQEISELRSRTVKPGHQTGVPLSALKLLVCPHCGKPLMVDDASISEEYVYSGVLRCSNQECPQNYQAVIDNGIIKTGNIYTAPYDSPDLKRGLYRNMGPDFSSALQKCADYISNKLASYNLHGKVLLEANVNGYFFLYQYLNLLPEDCICVVIDKYPETLEMYKSLIEQIDLKLNILYIADAGEHFPLRDSCVDLHISYFGENEYQLYHKQCFLHDVARHFKSNVKILGSQLSYDKTAKTRKNLQKKYPECSNRCAQADYLKEDYKALGYCPDLIEVGSIKDSGTYQYSFECHVRGEALRIYYFMARPYNAIPERDG